MKARTEIFSEGTVRTYYSIKNIVRCSRRNWGKISEDIEESPSFTPSRMLRGDGRPPEFLPALDNT